MGEKVDVEGAGEADSGKKWVCNGRASARAGGVRKKVEKSAGELVMTILIRIGSQLISIVK